MMGFLDQLQQAYVTPQINRGFANSGRAHNDMLGRYGGQTPPNPTPRPQDGFLSSLMSAAGQPGQSPQEARVGQPRAPEQGGGFLDSLHSGVSDNRGMLMGLGTGLLSNGWAGAGQAMGGMQYDEARRTQAEQQQQAEAQRAAMGQLGEQYGIDPLVFEAGMGEQALSQAMRPQEQELPSRARLAMEAGLRRGTPEYNQFLMGGDPQTNVTLNTGTRSPGGERVVEQTIDRQSELIAQGNEARATQQRMGTLNELLSAAPQGMEGRFTEIAAGMGFDVPGGDFTVAASAIINQLIPTQRVEGSGSTSDIEFAAMRASLPRIINQPEANSLIIQSIQMKSQYDIARGDIAREAQQRMISGNMTEAQSISWYNRQMQALDENAPSISEMFAQNGFTLSGAPASRPSSGGRFVPGPDGVLEYR